MTDFIRSFAIGILAMALSGFSIGQAINPAVTQANIHSTICAPGWSTSVRPDRFAMAVAKTKLIKAAGIPATDRGKYVLDHIVPIEVGGSPNDPKNFMLQTVADAKAKDKAENFAHTYVCKKVKPLSLADAQACFLAEWKTCPAN